MKRCAGKVKTEISGGVTLDRIPELAATGADYVSVGALTHSAPAADLSFELEPDATIAVAITVVANISDESTRGS